MAAIYKTPGVYVEEITKFPPSIAPVETAIPAFVGYTEKAIRNGEELFNKPIRIESIAEYEDIFGGGPSQQVTIYLDSNNNFVRGEADGGLYLYDSLRMFYANGGGNCYIVSVGKYPRDNAAIKREDIEKGLTALEQEDEPTIIVLPDAVSISGGPYSIQQLALKQCNNLKDRVTICDLAPAIGKEFKAIIDDFRKNIGINYLKYGAAYGPWIYADLPHTLLRRNVTLKSIANGIEIDPRNLTNDEKLKKLLCDIVAAENLIDKTSEGQTDHSSELQKLVVKFNAIDNKKEELQSALQGIVNYIIKLIYDIKVCNDTSPDPEESNFKLKEDIKNYIDTSNINTSMNILAAHHKYLSSDAGGSINIFITTDDTLKNAVNFLELHQDWIDKAGDVAKSYENAESLKKKGDVAIAPLLTAANEAITFFHFLEETRSRYEKTLNEAMLSAFGKFKELVTKGAEALNLLPPSGAIAGVYAAVDRERGVWKAPANVSLNSVIRPAIKISHEQQAEYNVDVNAGKSINIIRSFTGKGTLVWGARTLAGNDNEWRYINVRRFFNFAEESIKKATEQFVFEPNDANTWVRVQAMIENFLTTLWRQGALQGVKPDHAFYVAVGLGKTMTALDIQEGRMIIEIGMAVVRPAEFIILKFSHKMAES